MLKNVKIDYYFLGKFKFITQLNIKCNFMIASLIITILYYIFYMIHLTPEILCVDKDAISFTKTSRFHQKGKENRNL